MTDIDLTQLRKELRHTMPGQLWADGVACQHGRVKRDCEWCNPQPGTVAALDYPALNGRPVTDAHARICAERGHATYKRDGVDTGSCPRCGDVTIVTIPDWTRSFVTATVENEHREVVTQFTGWRAVLDPTHMQRYTTCDEWDLDIVADDALHGPDQCGDDCHEPGDRSTNLCGMSVPDGDERELVNAARTALAGQGFRIDGPWIPGPNGTLTAPLVPVILDQTRAAHRASTE